MRTTLSLALIFLAPRVVSCQNADTPPAVIMVSNSAVPNELYPGDQEQILEGSKHSRATVSSALTNAGVWGHDEGPSVVLQDTTNSGAILWYWGDTVTAYEASTPAVCMSAFCAYQVSSSCDGTAGDCLGVDTVSYISAADVANISSCNRLPVWDNNIVSGNTTSFGTCPTMTYITTHAPGSGIPLAGFTYNSLTAVPPGTCSSTNPAGNLCAGEDMLLGHTATGLFTLVDSSSNHHLYSNYEVESLPSAGGNISYRTESILLRTGSDTGSINSTTMPQLTRLTTFSQAPASLIMQGAASAVFLRDHIDAHGLHRHVLLGYLVHLPGDFCRREALPNCSNDHAGSSTLQVYGDVTPLNCPTSGNNFDAVPSQDTNLGKFMFVSPEILTTSLIASLGINSLLPAALQGKQLVCYWGSGFFYRNSNVYLGCMQGSDNVVKGSTYSSGLTDMYYLTAIDPHTGTPTLTAGAESTAIPLLSSWTMNTTTGANTPCVGEFSVRWVALLNRFLMTYGSGELRGPVVPHRLGALGTVERSPAAFPECDTAQPLGAADYLARRGRKLV